MENFSLTKIPYQDATFRANFAVITFNESKTSIRTQPADSFGVARVAKPSGEPSMANCTTPIQPDTELYYQAVGLVRGQYLPSQGSFSQGILLTEDGLMAPANLLGTATSLLEKHEELLQEPHIWIVYPRTKRQPKKNL
ncbi:MAG TPA: hypothetical protein V6D28_06825 [Leptolyngbyaceae cyanobacterium]